MDPLRDAVSMVRATSPSALLYVDAVHYAPHRLPDVQVVVVVLAVVAVVAVMAVVAVVTLVAVVVVMLVVVV